MSQKARRRATGIVGALVTAFLAVGGAIVAPATANAAPEFEQGTVADATFDWGVKTSFRNYIRGPIAHGSIENIGVTGTDVFQWTGGTGTGAIDGGSADVSFGGDAGVHFRGHETATGSGIFILDTRITNPRVVVNSATDADLYVDVLGREFKGTDPNNMGDFVDQKGLHFADLTLPAPTVSGTTVTWTNAAAALTQDGATALALYPAGEALDPVTFSAPVTPAAATTTTVAAPSGTVNAGDSVELTATVAPAAAGTVQFFNGGTPAGSPVTVNNGTATALVGPLAAGSNSITATFTPENANAYAGSTSAAVIVEAATVPAFEPKIEVFAADGTTPIGNTELRAGDTVVVKGSGFDPSANIGGRGVPIPSNLPQGVYLVFGDFAANWKPSVDAPAGNRAGGPQKWVLPESVLEQVPAMYQGTIRSQWAAQGTDGSFEAELELQSPVSAVNGTFGIYTYAAGGTKNAAQELAVPLNYQTVTSTAALAAPTAPVEFGSEVTLTTTVAPSAATGTVQYYYGATSRSITTALGEPVDVVNGVAELKTTALPRGAHFVKGVFTSAAPRDYSGTETAAATVQVNTIVTATALTVTPATSSYGDDVTLAATVTPATATGTVEFFNGTTSLGSSPASLLQVPTLTTNALPVGTASITAVFTPASEDYAASTSEAQTATVGALATTTTLTVDPAEIAFGGTAKLTAEVTPATSGTVLFKSNGQNLAAAVNVVAGKAELNAALPAGANTVTAEFTPADANHLASISNSASVTVVPGETALVLTANAATVQEFDDVTLTAQVSPAVAGKVTFTRNGVELGEATAANGVATLVTTEVTVGEPTFGASFTPANAAEYHGSSATGVQVVVTVRPPSVSVNPDGSSTVRQGEKVELVAGPFDPSVTHVRLVVQSDPIDLGVFPVVDRWVSVTLDWSKLPADFSGVHTATFTPVNADGTPIEGAQAVSATFTVLSNSGSGGNNGDQGSGSGTAPGAKSTGAKGLAQTGSDDLAGLTAAAVIVLLAGAGLMLARRRQTSAE